MDLIYNRARSGLARCVGRPSLAGRLLRAVLYRFSEFEAEVMRPGARVWLRRLYLRTENVRTAHPCFIGAGFRLYAAAPVTIGRRACIGENCGVYAHAPIVIGEDFLAAPGLTLNNGRHDPATMVPSATPLVIGDRVWCGVNVTIVAGARIGNDCVIGANSLVMSEIPSGSVAVGTPARIVKTNIRTGSSIWSCYDTPS